MQKGKESAAARKIRDMKKSLRRLLLSCGALLLIGAIGICVAFLFQRNSAENSFVAAQVSCEVHEYFDGQEYSSGTHLGHRKTEIYVKNTGNYPAFIRVRLVSYWVREDGKIDGLPSEMPTVSVAHPTWLESEENVYYYAKPVSPGEMTENLIKPITLTTSTDADGNTVYMVVQALAQAVQAKPDAAVEQAWGVTLTNGVITAVPNQKISGDEENGEIETVF